jgi:hypothetical protein
MRGIYFDGFQASLREDLPKPVPKASERLVRILMSGNIGELPETGKKSFAWPLFQSVAAITM